MREENLLLTVRIIQSLCQLNEVFFCSCVFSRFYLCFDRGNKFFVDAQCVTFFIYGMGKFMPDMELRCYRVGKLGVSG